MVKGRSLMVSSVSLEVMLYFVLISRALELILPMIVISSESKMLVFLVSLFSLPLFDYSISTKFGFLQISSSSSMSTDISLFSTFMFCTLAGELSSYSCSLKSEFCWTGKE